MGAQGGDEVEQPAVDRELEASFQQALREIAAGSLEVELDGVELAVRELAKLIALEMRGQSAWPRA